MQGCETIVKAQARKIGGTGRTTMFNTSRIRGDVGEDFEHSLHLKKACIEELKHAHFLLLIGEIKQHVCNCGNIKLIS